MRENDKHLADTTVADKIFIAFFIFYFFWKILHDGILKQSSLLVRMSISAVIEDFYGF